MMPAPTIPRVTRVAPDLGHAFGGVWRLTFRRFLTPGRWAFLGLVLALLALLTVASVRDGNARQFFQWTIAFYLVFLVPVAAFLSGAGSIRDEMRPVAVDYVLTRPVRRPALVAFKFLCHLACLHGIYLLSFAVLVGAGVFRHVPGLAAALPLLLLAQAITVTAFAALGFFFGALTTRYVVLGILYAGVVEVGLGRVPTQLNRLSMIHHVKAMLQPVFVETGRAATAPENALTTIGVLLLFAGVLVCASAAIFSLREFAGERTKDA